MDRGKGAEIRQSYGVLLAANFSRHMIPKQMALPSAAQTETYLSGFQSLDLLMTAHALQEGNRRAPYKSYSQEWKQTPNCGMISYGAQEGN